MILAGEISRGHKDQAPQSKQAAVYRNQKTTPCSLLMSVLLTRLEMPGTECNCLEDLTQNSVSLLLRGKIYWTLQEKKDGG